MILSKEKELIIDYMNDSDLNSFTSLIKNIEYNDYNEFIEMYMNDFKRLLSHSTPSQFKSVIEEFDVKKNIFS